MQDLTKPRWEIVKHNCLGAFTVKIVENKAEAEHTIRELRFFQRMLFGKVEDKLTYSNNCAFGFGAGIDGPVPNPPLFYKEAWDELTKFYNISKTCKELIPRSLEGYWKGPSFFFTCREAQ